MSAYSVHSCSCEASGRSKGRLGPGFLPKELPHGSKLRTKLTAGGGYPGPIVLDVIDAPALT